MFSSSLLALKSTLTQTFETYAAVALDNSLFTNLNLQKSSFILIDEDSDGARFFCKNFNFTFQKILSTLVHSIFLINFFPKKITISPYILMYFSALFASQSADS